MGEAIGCLLIGGRKRGRIDALEAMLRAQGVASIRIGRTDALLCSGQEGLYRIRRPGGTCIAAEGEMWAAALALAAQLHVDRILLLSPTDDRLNTKDEWERQIARLKAYARRNLFFCVSSVLVLESAAEESDGRMSAVYRRLCNASLRRVSLPPEKWTNCKQSLLSAAVHFLHAGDFEFTLAK